MFQKRNLTLNTYQERTFTHRTGGREMKKHFPDWRMKGSWSQMRRAWKIMMSNLMLKSKMRQLCLSLQRHCKRHIMLQLPYRDSKRLAINEGNTTLGIVPTLNRGGLQNGMACRWLEKRYLYQTSSKGRTTHQRRPPTFGVKMWRKLHVKLA